MAGMLSADAPRRGPPSGGLLMTSSKLSEGRERLCSSPTSVCLGKEEGGKEGPRMRPFSERDLLGLRCCPSSSKWADKGPVKNQYSVPAGESEPVGMEGPGPRWQGLERLAGGCQALGNRAPQASLAGHQSCFLCYQVLCWRPE